MKYVAKIGPPGKPNLKPDEIPYLGCYIKSIDQLGKVVLQFNITLIPELIFEEDLKRVLRFEITPEDDGSDADLGPVAVEALEARVYGGALRDDAGTQRSLAQSHRGGLLGGSPRAAALGRRS